MNTGGAVIAPARENETYLNGSNDKFSKIWSVFISHVRGLVSCHLTEPTAATINTHVLNLFRLNVCVSVCVYVVIHVEKLFK